MHILFVSSPVGPLGGGVNGGVELTMLNAASALTRRGHGVTVIAPAGSRMDGVRLVEAAGNYQPAAQHLDRTAAIAMPDSPVVASMWEAVRRRQTGHSLVVNFAYDWLPLYLTPFFKIPVCHLISMASVLDAMDTAIREADALLPGCIAMHTRAQAGTFGMADRCTIIGNGLDLVLYAFNPTPERRLCWIGRIAPEKGLEDALAAAAQAGVPLDILGLVEDQEYWQQVRREHPQAPIDYHGFMNTADMVAVLRRAQALLVTPKWTEAFGNVVMEALACGVPVIAYRRGGPAELVEDGRTGYLVEPDSIEALVRAIDRVPSLDRRACRLQAEKQFSLETFGERLQHWFDRLLTDSRAAHTP